MWLRSIYKVLGLVAVVVLPGGLVFFLIRTILRGIKGKEQRLFHPDRWHLLHFLYPGKMVPVPVRASLSEKLE